MKKRVILTLQDCSVIPMNLPPLKKKDATLAAEALLPARYPHSLEGMIWDIIKRDDQSLVFLMKKDRLEEIRQEYGTHIEIFCTTQFIPALADTTQSVCRWSYPEGQDLYFLRGNTLEQAVYTTTEQEKNSLITSLYPEDIPLIMDLKENQISSKKVSLNLFRAGPEPYNRPLFQIHQKPFLSILIPLLPPIALLISLFLSFGENEQLKAELTEQQKFLTRQKMYRNDPLEEYPWEQVHNVLNDNLPNDYYAFLEILYSSFKGRGEIMTLSIEGREWHLEAVGSNGMIILEDLKNRGSFSHLMLHQLRRDKDLEFFSLSGSLK